MGERSLTKKIDEISILLYQNKEKEALEEVANILKVLQEQGARVIAAYKDVSEEFVVGMLRDLLTGYQNKDMLAMADCLQQKASLLAELSENI